MFRPPLTPGSPYFTTPELAVARRRTRADSSIKLNTAVVHGAFTNGQDSWSSNDTARATSPAPLANPRYTLAGGFDTPTLAAAAYYDKVGDFEESQFRQRWDNTKTSPTCNQDDLTTQGPLARERNGHGRLSSSTSSFSHYQIAENQSAAPGWGKFVFSLASTVAGKVLHFCRESAFRGFHAGAGKGYDFSEPTQLHVDHSWDGYFRSTTPIPGQYPRERDFSGDFEQDNRALQQHQEQQRQEQQRSAKRLHTESGSGWVVVNSNLETRESSPRLTARKVSNPLLAAMDKPATSSASRASSRRSLIPVSRRTTTSSQVSQFGSPLLPRQNHLEAPYALTAQHHERRASTPSTRSPLQHARNPSRPSSATASPLTPQAQNVLAKRDRRDKEAEKSMRKMSRQLQDLIRQGQAALGTRYEIEDTDIDEGFEDGDGDGEDWEDAATW
ncbi:hypothetical protein BDV97DRAFT_367428 [Delphinella strobiligena]|nr:hypothetical protein BDV97DRAFT_367428 [Delphinella strobiligena]